MEGSTSPASEETVHSEMVCHSEMECVQGCPHTSTTTIFSTSADLTMDDLNLGSGWFGRFRFEINTWLN